MDEVLEKENKELLNIIDNKHLKNIIKNILNERTELYKGWIANCTRTNTEISAYDVYEKYHK